MKVRELVQRLCAEDMDADVIFFNGDEGIIAPVRDLYHKAICSNDGAATPLVCLCGRIWRRKKEKL